MSHHDPKHPRTDLHHPAEPGAAAKHLTEDTAHHERPSHTSHHEQGKAHPHPSTGHPHHKH